ncbi:hydrolase [Clostridium lundense]|uniref:hydrolase n=1 Tax=Clostridium lundense TaxID=319475 RepID=UPI00048540F8|nr:hydrolase [Clostridium lundense]
MENRVKDKKYVPVIETRLRKRIVEVPKEIYDASGINVLGKRIKSLIFSTDVAIIKNSNADGVIAVYPFTPQLSITHAIIEVSPSPVFVGVGGGLTTGQRSIDIALNAELYGAFGVVMNAPTPNELIKEMKQRIDIPIVITVVSEKENIEERIKAGVSIFNVSGGAKTAQIVENIRRRFPDVAIIATGGQNVESIRNTIKAGANAITYTPPSTGEMFSDIMDKYRETL